jgi:hypothetical protein
MAKNQTRRIAPSTLQADEDAFNALKAITGYTPSNPAYAVAAIETSRVAMEAKQTAETQAEAAFDTARDAATAAEWDYHNNVLGATLQVAAQYGKDSDEYQAIGKKKTSEYKAPQRKPGGSATK